ncbi:hypothetical protein QFC20_006735 [Naganishia adeliensis]|uniref:Uncharacterized protein n=1 Tax=Naganishia adeliensis TaxID=92952 RepID=A0ACC2V849_9TREE|nr:hypothetical protein QFC20_006735 [Naganishia adeliensis]
MLTAFRVAISIVKYPRAFSTSTSLRDITRIPIKLPSRRNTTVYAFLERFQIILLVDSEKRTFYAEESLKSTESKREAKIAVHKKFPTRDAAEAFLGNGTNTSSQPYSIPSVPLTERGPPKKASKGYYAVKSGLKPGIYNDWAEVEPMVKGIQGAVYKRFPTKVAAEDFINGAESRPPSSEEFDAASEPTELLNETTRGSRNAIPPSITNTSPSADQEPDQQRELARNQGFTITSGPSGSLVVYTDGSSRGNGQRGATAGSGIWWADKGHARTLNLAERLPGQLQTNNRAELLAIIRALESCPFPQLPLEIRTDSQYSIACITQYLPSWIKNNFVSTSGQPVKNKDMIVHLLALLNQRGPKNGVRFVHVRAHRGEVGNEDADLLANTGAARQIVPDRLDWFTLEDANRFTTRRQDLLRQSRNETAQSSAEPIRERKAQKSGPTIPSEDDIIPVEIEKWRLLMWSRVYREYNWDALAKPVRLLLNITSICIVRNHNLRIDRVFDNAM